MADRQVVSVRSQVGPVIISYSFNDNFLWGGVPRKGCILELCT